MSTVYIHIGTPKTGTSAIQVFMQKKKNRKLLKQHGYDYPNLGFDFPGINSNRNAHCLNPFIYDSNKKRQRDKEKEVVEQAFDKIEKRLEKVENLIFSDEQMWNNKDIDKERLTYFKERLAKAGADLKIIVYFRRQDLLIQSYWAQQVKENMTISFSEYIKSKKAQYFKLDYAKRLDEIAQAVGKENIIVRAYEKQQYYGGTILSDFLHIFDIELTEEFVLPKQAINVSLDGACLEAKRLLNYNKLYTTKMNFVVPMLTAVQQEKMGETGYSTAKYFSNEEHEEFLKKYEEGNRKVAREYMGREDGILFRDEVVLSGDGKAATYTSKELVQILGEVIAQQQEIISEKEKEIEEFKAPVKGKVHWAKRVAKRVLGREE